MKYLVLVADGMADQPNGETPLEAADTKNLDEAARLGRCGLLRVLEEGRRKDSDVANLILLGYRWEEHPEGRGPLEALAAGVKLSERDLAFRCNLVEVREDRIVSHSAKLKGWEARELFEALNSELGSEGVEFVPGVGYRGLLILRGVGEVELRCEGPHNLIGEAYGNYMPKAVNRASKRVEGLLKELIERSAELLRERRSMIWPWGQGKLPRVEGFEERHGLKGSMVAEVNLIKGIGLWLGMRVPHFEGATGGLDTNYKAEIETALKELEDVDFAYLHLEAPDEAGHQGSFELKVEAIERFDEVIVSKALDWFLEDKDRKLAVLADHATPWRVRKHTADPVPFCLVSGEKPDACKEFNERSAAKGELGMREGLEFMKLLTK